jgi:ArsR family transcriptional regulator
VTEEALPLRELTIKSKPINDAGLVLNAINNKTRRQILHLLQGNKRMNVSSLCRGLGKPQAVTSVHLSILRNASIVIRQKEKQYVFYSVDYNRLRNVSEIAEALLSF